MLVGCVLAGVLASIGCRRVLFRADDDRSPYARYDRVRADDPPPYLQDEFGRRIPNLRGRLLARE